jgi:hypothetical protein
MVTISLGTNKALSESESECQNEDKEFPIEKVQPVTSLHHDNLPVSIRECS